MDYTVTRTLNKRLKNTLSRQKGKKKEYMKHEVLYLSNIVKTVN